MSWFSLYDIGGTGEYLGHVTGYYIKRTYLPYLTWYSRVARPTPVASLETVGANPDPHTHYETELGIGLEFGHHPVDLPESLQRPFEGE